MVFKQGKLEKQMDAPNALEEARDDLDEFHESLDVSGEQEEVYQEAKELETEFEKALFYSVSSTDAILTEARERVEEMTNGSGRPDDVIKDVKEVYEGYREYSREMLEKAEDRFDEMLHTYRSLEDLEGADVLDDAEEKYDEVFDDAEDEIEKVYDVSMLVHKQVNQQTV